MGKGVITASVKYGGGFFRPKQIIVTSNHHPKDIWPSSKDYIPILNRVQLYRQISYGVRVYEDTGYKTDVTVPLTAPPPAPTAEDVFGV
jgi:hypothetical protein